MADLRKFRRLIKQIPAEILTDLKTTIEKMATQLVLEMRAIVPEGSGITVDWTWGNAPEGTIAIARSGGRIRGGMFVTIFARAENSRSPFRGIANLAAAFEFGTKERVQRTTGRYTGSMPAQPYFFPVYRANKTRIRSNITRSAKRGAKKAKR